MTATALQQGSSNPALAWSPSSLTYDSTQLGQSSAPQLLTFKNIGTLPVTFSSTTISGLNASDFSAADLCTPSVVLQPNSTCTVSITFSPSAGGMRQATFMVTDDAVGSPQAILLSGTAPTPPPPAPAVSLNPSGTFTFPGTTTQGTSGLPQNITLTNSGNGTLHVTSIVLSGFNVNDFTLGTSNCLGAIPPAGSCLIPITFAPLAAGIRSAALNIADDAADSPQTLTLNGTASAAVTIGAAPAGSTSATISAGQTAQYNLQITPGAGYTGTVSLTYTGAPPGATIQGPSTLQVSNGNAAPFMVSVTRSGGARAILPFSETPRLMRFPFLRTSPGLILAVTLLLLLAFAAKHHLTARLPRLAFSSAFTAIIFLLMLSALLVAAGCGGGSAAVTTPPQIVTPQGQSMIIVTPSATSTNGKPLQLQAIQLTLTVN